MVVSQEVTTSDRRGDGMDCNDFGRVKISARDNLAMVHSVETADRRKGNFVHYKNFESKMQLPLEKKLCPSDFSFRCVLSVCKFPTVVLSMEVRRKFVK